MRLVEHFDAVLVLHDGHDDMHGLLARLAAAGLAPTVVDLAAPQGWRHRLEPLLGRPRCAQATGVLLIARPPGAEHELWKSQDRLIERLESRDWEIAFLGHDEGVQYVSDGVRPDLMECNLVPPGLSVVALRWSMLDTVVELMPDRAVAGTLSPTDWLTIVSWIAHPLLRSSRPLLAWPPLVRSGARQQLPTAERPG